MRSDQYFSARICAIAVNTLARLFVKIFYREADLLFTLTLTTCVNPADVKTRVHIYLFVFVFFSLSFLKFATETEKKCSRNWSWLLVFLFRHMHVNDRQRFCKAETTVWNEMIATVKPWTIFFDYKSMPQYRLFCLSD